MTDEEKYVEKRDLMVSRQIKARGINDERLLEVMRTVPRHLFVPEKQLELAYEDYPLAIGEGQTISQPYIVAEMTNALKLSTNDRVLEIGTGSGYQAAILSQLVHTVFSIERRPNLLSRAQKVFSELEYSNIITQCVDGTKGWIEESPFDAIIVTAAAPSILSTLTAQLKIGGRMIIPAGDRDVQGLYNVYKDEDGVKVTDMLLVKFVPLIGVHGWKEEHFR